MAWDYVIVGAGAAGCVMADRLSADGRSTVLLIEAGPRDRHPMIHMPHGVARIVNDERHITRFMSEADGDIPAEPWRRGRMLGGTTSLNTMMYFRGHPRDYDEWAEAGLIDWSWAAMEPAFEAIEARLRPEPGRDVKPLSEAWIAAGQAMGLPRVDDMRGSGEGVGYASRSIADGRRRSAAVAFLHPSMRRPNLTVKTGVSVDRVLFEGKRAVCVLADDGREYRTNREVLLSAGALQSPLILQRSGIGPADHLAAMGVPVIHDSPQVGENLREHRLFMMRFRLTRPLSRNFEMKGWRLLANVLRYYLARSGPMADSPYDVAAFARAEPDADRPDIELLASPYSIMVDAKGRQSTEPAHGMQMLGYPLRAQSQGRIRIGGRDPSAPPQARGNYLADPYDQRLSIAMYRYMRHWIEQPSLRDLIDPASVPAEIERDEDVVTTFRQRGGCGSHALGTVALGADASSPLDPELRVRGVEGLRVVDGSSLPTMPSANPAPAIMATAWRIGEAIRQA